MKPEKQQQQNSKITLPVFAERERALNQSAVVSVAELLSIASRLQQCDRYLNLREVCELTGFSKRSIQKAKDLPRYKPLDGSIRFRLSEIHAWMQRHSEQCEPGKQDAFILKIRRTMGAKL